MQGSNVASDPSHEDALNALLHERPEVVEVALRALPRDQAEQVIARAWADLRGPERVAAAARLGDVRGAHGSRLLREALAVRGPGSRDLRCAALLALAQREGAAASAELTAALTARDGTVRDYAVLGLAAHGDGRAWDLVLAHLVARLQPRRRSWEAMPTRVVAAVTYLAQHLDEEVGRTSRLEALLRRSAERLQEDEREWIARRWPGAASDDLAAGRRPDSRAMRADLVEGPLFHGPRDTCADRWRRQPDQAPQ